MKTEKELDGKKEIYLKCDCSSEILHVEYDEDFKLYDVCIYRYSGFSEKLSWKQRLRFAWKLITSGKIYGDQMMLSRKSAKELQKFLTISEYYAFKAEIESKSKAQANDSEE